MAGLGWAAYSCKSFFGCEKLGSLVEWVRGSVEAMLGVSRLSRGRTQGAQPSVVGWLDGDSTTDHLMTALPS